MKAITKKACPTIQKGYLSIHTYLFHDTNYNPSFCDTNSEATESKKEKIEAARTGQ